jgi:hypothetical protein
MPIHHPDTESIESIAHLITRHIDRQQGSPKRRDQHPKQHGCVKARFCIEPHLWERLPEACRVGVLSKPHTFPAWVRFSTLKEQDDSKGDIHGMAVKVLLEDSEGKGLEPDKASQTQDFVFIDAPRFFIKGVKPYLQLFQVLDWIAALKDPGVTEPPSNNKLALIFKILVGLFTFLMPSFLPSQWRFRELWILVTAKLQKKLFRISSPLDQKYWSTTPYRLGSTDQAVRYFVKPSAINQTDKPKRYTPNYLRESLVEHLTHQQQQARFDFYIQVKQNPTLTDLDDATMQWKDVPEYKVATIQIPPQQFYSDTEPAFGESLSFTPWHCLPEHEPLGSMNAIRQRVYLQASQLRNTLNHDLPLPKPPQELPRRSPTGQTPLTAILTLRTDNLDALKAELEKISRQMSDPAQPTWFAKSPSTHFARWVILDDPEQNIANRLLFISNHDGTIPDYLQELVETIGPEMDSVWRHCEGYQPGDALDVEAFTQFMLQHSLKPQAFYIGCRDTTASEILAAKTLRQRVDRLAQTYAADLEAPLRELSALTPGRSPQPTLPAWVLSQIERLRNLAIFLQSWVGIFPSQNNPGDRIVPQPSQKARLQTLTDIEDQCRENCILPNQLTTVSPIKSKFHKLILRIVLGLVNLVGQTSRGRLIGISSIHFARWVIVDQGILNDSRTSYLIFESNYRGSWDNYLNDFVYKTLIPMNLIWGNLKDFPVKGCQDMEMFKQHQRLRQYPAQVYYCAYPELSVQNILCDRTLARAMRDLEDYLNGSYNLLSTAPDPLLMQLVKLIGQSR